jgi:hypothetical protein
MTNRRSTPRCCSPSVPHRSTFGDSWVTAERRSSGRCQGVVMEGGLPGGSASRDWAAGRVARAPHDPGPSGPRLVCVGWISAPFRWRPRHPAARAGAAAGHAGVPPRVPGWAAERDPALRCRPGRLHVRLAGTIEMLARLARATGIPVHLGAPESQRPRSARPDQPRPRYALGLCWPGVTRPSS